MRLACLLIAALLPLACATTWSAGQEPLRHGASPTPLVQAWLNGQGPFVFLIDTGSPNCVVSEAVAESLNLSSLGKGTIQGVGTEAASVSVVDRVEVGGIGVQKVPVVVAALPGADGLLGNSFLRHYRVTLDYPHRHLTLEPR